jgi:hypothetical protein
MTTDYVANAIAAMKAAPLGGTDTNSAPVQVKTDISEQEPELNEEALVVEPEAEEKPEVKEAPKKSLSDIAREKQAARQAKEAAKPLNTLEARLGPQGLHQLTQALEGNDTAAILRALGVKPGDVQYQEVKEKISEVSEKPGDPAVSELKKELEDLKAERQAEKYRQGRAKTLEVVKELAADDEFALISDDEQAMSEALNIVEDFIKQHGEWPAETREESIRLGLREVHAKAEKEAKRWEKVLTKWKKPAIGVPEESPEQPTRAVSEVANRSLTNSSFPAPAKKAITPKSDEDYRDAAVAAIRKLSKP